MKYVPPSIRETAFNCPHCVALARQSWYNVYAELRPRKTPVPTIVYPGSKDFEEYQAIPDEDVREKLLDWAAKSAKGKPFIESYRQSVIHQATVHNISLSICFNCEEISVWLYDRLVYPQFGEAPPANPDLPDDVRRDYDEAGAILSLSPRGAAALIRLGLQKLCKHLGQPGENINADIKALVSKGLDPLVQKALDAVRIVGNNAVHPGEIDIADDRATAESLFRLTNLIAEKMISEPKHVDEFYQSLPEGARKAVEKRDAKEGH